MTCPTCNKDVGDMPVRFMLGDGKWRCRECQDKIGSDKFRVLAIKDTDKGGKDISIELLK